MDKITIACFGLQGFGNNLLEAAAQHPKVSVTALYTRKSAFQFGYYDCEPLEEIAKKLGVQVYYIPDKDDWDCAAGTADLAIISSFHRIFKPKHLANFRRAVNIHPSLLPAYKGATPTNWMIKNGERIAGLSAHLVDEGIDTGEILFRQKLLNPYLNDNDLRKALAFFSGKIIENIIDAFPNYQPVKNDENIKDSFQAGRADADSVLDIKNIESLEQLIFHIKAFTNFPMPKLLIGEKIFVVDYENPRESIEININDESFSVIGYWK